MSIRTHYIRKFRFLEHFDPGGIVFKLTMRTIVAALIGVIVFHLYGKPYMGVWVGFSAQFIMQTDPGVFFDCSKRLLFVFIVTVLFSFLVFVGSLLASNMIAFSIALGVVAFIAAYASSFGKVIYNAAIWALVCFLLMTAVPKEHVAPWVLMVLFFVGGIIALLVLRLSMFMHQRGRASALFSKTLFQASLWVEAMVRQDKKAESEYQRQVKNSLRLQQTQVMFLGTRARFFKSLSMQSTINVNKAIQRLYPFLIIAGKMKHSVYGRSYLFSSELDALLRKLAYNLSVLSDRITGNAKRDWGVFTADKLLEKFEKQRDKILSANDITHYDEMFLVSNFYMLYKTFDRRLLEIDQLILNLEAK